MLLYISASVGDNFVLAVTTFLKSSTEEYVTATGFPRLLGPFATNSNVSHGLSLNEAVTVLRKIPLMSAVSVYVLLLLKTI